MLTRRIAIGSLLIAAIAGCAAPQDAVKQGYLFAGGQYVDTKAGQIMAGQMVMPFT